MDFEYGGNKELYEDAKSFLEWSWDSSCKEINDGIIVLDSGAEGHLVFFDRRKWGSSINFKKEFIKKIFPCDFPLLGTIIQDGCGEGIESAQYAQALAEILLCPISEAKTK